MKPGITESKKEIIFWPKGYWSPKSIKTKKVFLGKEGVGKKGKKSPWMFKGSNHLNQWSNNKVVLLLCWCNLKRWIKRVIKPAQMCDAFANFGVFIHTINTQAFGTTSVDRSTFNQNTFFLISMTGQFKAIQWYQIDWGSETSESWPR